MITEAKALPVQRKLITEGTAQAALSILIFRNWSFRIEPVTEMLKMLTGMNPYYLGIATSNDHLCKMDALSALELLSQPSIPLLFSVEDMGFYNDLNPRYEGRGVDRVIPTYGHLCYYIKNFMLESETINFLLRWDEFPEVIEIDGYYSSCNSPLCNIYEQEILKRQRYKVKDLVMSIPGFGELIERR